VVGTNALNGMTPRKKLQTRERKSMKTAIVVFDPVHPYTDFKVYINIENAQKYLENEGFILDASRVIKPSTRVRLVYKKNNEERYVYCRLVEDCEENKN
jgi:hypothetical protein